MSTKINNVAVIGTGVIGTGWSIRMLAHNKKVTAFDLNIKQKAILVKEVKRSLPFVKKLFKKKID
jgi:carnitine 3-dehydrogenase